MRLEGIELRRVTLGLVRPFETSSGAVTARDALLVRAVSAGADGWGECVAMAEPRYSAEYVDGAAEVMRRFLVPALAAADELTAEGVASLLSPFRGHPMAKAALEMAVLDAELRAADTSFATRLGAVRDSVPVGVSIGIVATVGELLDVVAGYLEEGYGRVKLKIKPGWDTEPVAAVRGHFGDTLALQVDANAAYSLDDADRLARLDQFGLLLVEQPLADDDLRGHAELARRIATPICLDESITSARAAADAVAMGACRVINLKAGRVGGYLEAKRVHDVCVALGVPVWCGGMLETGLGRAANVALAALPGFTLPGDISASSRYFARDLTEPFVLEAGQLAVPTGAGLGVEPDSVYLAEVTTANEWIAFR